ncbi:DUF882 domain-containing protein [Devosia sp.]|uniref:DUF882 domain-containing protein n=1 Tax=Devosia sp. TaxID=1871048 RepID=UPI0026145582|nr:DUF882 domain-containing protein [Devosia sp.]
MTLSAVLVPAPAQAATERALYLYYTHTKETARIVFKRNGQYVQSGLNELNQFLRDWRRNEPTRMDPRLFDLVWEVYQDVGATQPINIVSAYRSPATNAMLASKSSGVADNSQHMRGTAMDFFIPGIALNKLRAAAMRKQVGGVGYYPTSGSPFVHLDTGSVRAWPRMTRAQLKDLFPDGRTMHVPTDGKPLSQEGYQVALAEWKKCHSYPCGGSSSGTQVASSGGSGRSLMDVLFGGNDSGGASAAVAAQAPVQTAALAQPRRVDPVMPDLRPAAFGAPATAETLQVAAIDPDPALPFSTTGSAPLTDEELRGPLNVAVTLPVAKPEALRVATASALPSGDAVTALAALTGPSMPRPRVIMTDPPSETLSAYLPTSAPDPEAQRALEMIISGSAGTSVAAALPTNRLPSLPGEAPVADRTIQTAALGTPPAAAYGNLFDQTFGNAGSATASPLAAALSDHVANSQSTMRRPDLIAPDLDHVAEVFMAPATLSSDHFAVIFDHDEADFDPTPEMGDYRIIKGIGGDAPIMAHTRFVPTL